MSARVLLACCVLALGSLPALATAPTVDADAVFAALDSDHDQALSRQEFQAGYARVQQAIAIEARLRQQFAVVDLDRSGALDEAEFAKLPLVARLGSAAPALAAFDANRDRQLAYPEYRNVVQRLGAAPASAKE
jgi:Ca2+-binding EF-hand superfamily protein